MDKVEKEGEDMRIVSTMPISEEYIKPVSEKYDFIEWIIKDNMEEARPWLSKAEIFLTLGFDTLAADIEKAEQLKWIHVLSAGVDQMPFDVIQNKQILLTNTRGIHKIPMSEYVIGVMLDHVKKTLFFHEMQKKKTWERRRDIGELYGKTLVVVGTGSIGKDIAHKGKVFGMHTIGVNTSGSEEEFFDQIYSRKDLNEALSQGDFVVIVVPLTQETQNMIGREQFKAMKENAYFINIARGPVVKEEDLIHALQSKDIGGAALDVFTIEPLSSNSPLWTLENVFITPHVSGVTASYTQRAFELFVKNLEVYIEKKGRYINIVDLERQY